MRHRLASGWILEMGGSVWICLWNTALGLGCENPNPSTWVSSCSFLMLLLYVMLHLFQCMCIVFPHSECCSCIFQGGGDVMVSCLTSSSSWALPTLLPSPLCSAPFFPIIIYISSLAHIIFKADPFKSFYCSKISFSGHQDSRSCFICKYLFQWSIFLFSCDK